jgi:LysM repeat protein
MYIPWQPGIMRQPFTTPRERTVIAKSDLFILITASAALSFGVFRWNQNTQAVDAITIPASSRTMVVEPVVEASPTVIVVEPTPEVTATDVVSTENLSTEIAEPVVVTPVVAEQPKFANHVVTSGESLSIIAYRYGTTVRTLRELNGIRGSTIQIGQNIQYPVDP